MRLPRVGIFDPSRRALRKMRAKARAAIEIKWTRDAQSQLDRNFRWFPALVPFVVVFGLLGWGQRFTYGRAFDEALLAGKLPTTPPEGPNR